MLGCACGVPNEVLRHPVRWSPQKNSTVGGGSACGGFKGRCMWVKMYEPPQSWSLQPLLKGEIDDVSNIWSLALNIYGKEEGVVACWSP